MLTEQELDRLAGGLGGLAYDYNEEQITITQDPDTGSLTFVVVQGEDALMPEDRDGAETVTWYAKPAGQYQESPLYEFWRDGENAEEYGNRVCTLVPSMIYGLIAL